MTARQLKKWKAERGYSGAKLGEALGVSRVTVHRWETGKRKIPPFLSLALECLKKKKR